MMMFKLILVPVSITLLSFAWCPRLKKLQIDHDLEFVADDGSEENESNGYASRTGKLVIFAFPLTLSGPAFSVVCQARGGGSEAQMPKIKVNFNQLK